MPPTKRVSVKGKGADLFFGGADSTPTSDVSIEEASTTPDTSADASSNGASDNVGTEESVSPPIRSVRPSRRREASKQNKEPASISASVLASTLGEIDTDVVHAIRKTVKVPGREVSYVRLTADEKNQLAEIVYTYRRQGKKTTENEINRIAVNFLLLDYGEHGEQSILARVLDALRA
jgi:hypothetical protein